MIFGHCQICFYVLKKGNTKSEHFLSANSNVRDLDYKLKSCFWKKGKIRMRKLLVSGLFLKAFSELVLLVCYGYVMRNYT